MKYLLGIAMIGCVINSCMNCVRRRYAMCSDFEKGKMYLFKQLKSEGLLVLLGIIFWLLYM